MTRKIIVAILTAGLSTPAIAAQDAAPSGIYLMQGRGFGSADSEYRGTCSFSGDGPAFEVSCFNEATRHTYVGRGLAMGDKLAIAIGDELRGDHRTVFAGEYLVLYARNPDGSFEGTWIAADGATGRESLTPLD